MNNEIIKELQKKYSFLTPLEAKTLYLIAKNDIDYQYINSIKSSLIITYLTKYVKYVKKINKKNSLEPIVEVNKTHLDTLFLLKKNKISLKHVCKILEKNDVTISYHPFNKLIINKAKRNIFINRSFSFSIMITSMIVMIYCLLNINAWHKENVKISKISTEVMEKVDIIEEEPPKQEEIISDDYFKYLNISLLDVNLDNLLNQNKDTKGWIKVSGTNVNYPFVQSYNNEYYLYHSFDGAYNTKGWVYLDYRNDINNIGKNTILYAHGLVNNAMFGSLRKVLKKDWAENQENRIIKISTLNQNMLFEVFSTYKIPPESYYITTDFSSDSEYEKFLNTLKSRSFYDYGIELTSSDRILTLSSCYDNSERMVLHAKLIAISNKND